MTDSLDRALRALVPDSATAPDGASLRERIAGVRALRARCRRRVLATGATVTALGLLAIVGTWAATRSGVTEVRVADRDPSLLFERRFRTDDPAPDAGRFELRAVDLDTLTPFQLTGPAGAFGPFGEQGRFVPAADCGLAGVEFRLGGSGSSAAVPMGRVQRPTAVSVGRVQVSFSEPIEVRPLVLVYADEPGLRLRATFPDGTVDEVRAGDDDVVAVLGGPRVDDSLWGVAGVRVEAFDGSGARRWSRDSVTVPDLGRSDPARPCWTPGPDAVGEPADTATTAAVQRLLTEAFAVDPPADGYRELVEGWTPELDEGFAAARELAVSSGRARWGVEIVAVRSWEATTWAAVRLDLWGDDFWVQVVERDGSWRMTRASVCAFPAAELCPGDG